MVEQQQGADLKELFAWGGELHFEVRFLRRALQTANSKIQGLESQLDKVKNLEKGKDSKES